MVHLGPSSISESERKASFFFWGRRCFFCHKPLSLDGKDGKKKPTFHHLIPREVCISKSDGNSSRRSKRKRKRDDKSNLNNPLNLVPTCYICHLKIHEEGG